MKNRKKERGRMNMATVIDITNKLKNEEKFVKIGEKSFKVDASKNTMIEVFAMMQQMENGGFKEMDRCIEKLVGKEGMKEINSMNLDFADYKVVYIAIMAAATDTTYEEAESRFQK